MNRYCFPLVLLFVFTLMSHCHAQVNTDPLAEGILKNRGELYFSFLVTSPDEVSDFSRLISIDHIDGVKVYAYANKKGFSQFLNKGKPYTILPSPGLLTPEKELAGMDRTGESDSKTIWNFYPTYQQYIDYMTGFASLHPDICNIDTLGNTIQGRLLLAVKISDNVNQQEAEPRVFYTASIHGDETAGFVLMLHLIDYLLMNYGVDPKVTNLIQSTEIFINPLANPDGTYYGGNHTVFGSVRYNANAIDLNRNYPDPRMGPHPDGEEWQPETQAFMSYGENNHFTMSANFHGGAEVFNYPWDTWPKLTSDDNWWQRVGREWADTVHKYGPSGYFNDLDNGITNGHAWYEITGGRQDYMNFWNHCREVTVEISDVKILPVNQLENFWEYNHRSFLNFIEESHYGLTGFVTDSITGQPVFARVFIANHDQDSSEVFSYLPSGFYARPIYEGSYDVTFSASGYNTKTIYHIVVHNRQTTPLNVQLKPLSHGIDQGKDQTIRIYPNPGNGDFEICFPAGWDEPGRILICSAQGDVVVDDNLKMSPGVNCYRTNLRHLPEGLYIVRFISGELTLTNKFIIRYD